MLHNANIYIAIVREIMRLVSSCMNMWFAHHLNRGHVLYNCSKYGTEHIDQDPLHARVW